MQDVDKIFEEVILRIYLFVNLFYVFLISSFQSFLFIFKVFRKMDEHKGGVGERCPEGNIVLFLEMG